MTTVVLGDIYVNREYGRCLHYGSVPPNSGILDGEIEIMGWHAPSRYLIVESKSDCDHYFCYGTDYENVILKCRFIHCCSCGLFVSRRRRFDRLECQNCIYKGGSYCWSQCPYNIWKREPY